MDRGEPDVLFDFDEEWNEEWPAPRASRWAGGGDRRIPTRLAGLTVAFIVVTVLIITSANGCGVVGLSAASRAYLLRLAAVAASSERTGGRFSALVARPRGEPSVLSANLAQLAKLAAQDALAASRLRPPPTLQDAQAFVVQVLDIRAGALQGFSAAAGPAAAVGAGRAELLLALADRLLASDVIWRDLVEARTKAALANQGLVGVAVPASIFLTPPDLASTNAMGRLWRTLSGREAGASRRTLKLGDHGAAVVRWQKLLARWLRRSGSTTLLIKPDGDFGPATDALTRRFQTARGLVPDGVVGKRTGQAMTAVLGTG